MIMSTFIKNLHPKAATHIEEPPIAKYLFANTYMAGFCLFFALKFVTSGSTLAAMASIATCYRCWEPPGPDHWQRPKQRRKHLQWRLHSNNHKQAYSKG